MTHLGPGWSFKRSRQLDLPGRVSRIWWFWVMLATPVFTSGLCAAAPGKVDFANDVQPLLRENCFDCHGPAKQKAGMRLDRRSSALKAFSRRVMPGSSANSMVYHRLIGNEFGTQMPPKGRTSSGSNCHHQDLDRPGSQLAGLARQRRGVAAAQSKSGTAMVDALRNDDLGSFMRAAEAAPSLLNARGPEGSTPFMYAVLYSDTATLARLLKLGADPNRHNDVNATALMWAASRPWKNTPAGQARRGRQCPVGRSSNAPDDCGPPPWSRADREIPVG